VKEKKGKERREGGDCVTFILFYGGPERRGKIVSAASINVIASSLR